MKQNQDITSLVENLSNHLFWDTDKSSLLNNSSEIFILERVMEYGNIDDWRVINNFYGKEKLKELVVHLKNISDKSFAFLSNYFDIPKEKFRCYTKNQSQRNFWNA
jgi:ribosomal protein S8